MEVLRAGAQYIGLSYMSTSVYISLKIEVTLLLDCRTLTVLLKQCSCCGMCVPAYFVGLLSIVVGLYKAWLKLY